MLKSLSIKNFAVIQALQIEFHAGLNLLTGETGSGKSIIVDALGLLLGDRSTPTQIRTGERVAIIEGLFSFKGINDSEMKRALVEARIEKGADPEILIRRELYDTGRNRVFINGKPSTILALRTLQPFLVEIHGQGEQRALLSKQSHLDLLDSFADCLSLRHQVADAYSQWIKAREALAQLEREATERERASDLLQYQLTEIEALAPKPNEDEELQAERKLLTHAETVLQLASGSYMELYDSDASVLSRLATVQRSLEELSQIDNRLNPVAELLENCVASLSDIAETLRDYGAKLEFSPSRLAEIENRLAELERVKRRYNTNLQGVLEILDELSRKLYSFSEIAEREPLLRADLLAAEGNYRVLAKSLSRCRYIAKGSLEKRVMRDLKHVAMEDAQFIVAISPSALGSDNQVEVFPNTNSVNKASDNFSPNGIDDVEFLLSANPGESPRPLAHVASGGELSRLMLTLRTIGKKDHEPRSMVETAIFDEVDVGIGGRVAEAVGRRLQVLAATMQVLCVTHQPQLARFADQHYLLEKRVEKGRTQTFVKELNLDERIGELARMIGGDEQAPAARETARWLLESVNKHTSRSVRAKKSSKL
jgi:DNA repair protein RecN (Recombination protein N)